MFSRNFKCLQTQKLLHMLSTNMSSFLQLPINNKLIEPKVKEKLWHRFHRRTCVHVHPVQGLPPALQEMESLQQDHCCPGTFLLIDLKSVWVSSIYYMIMSHCTIIRIFSHVSIKKGESKKNGVGTSVT